MHLVVVARMNESALPRAQAPAAVFLLGTGASSPELPGQKASTSQGLFPSACPTHKLSHRLASELVALGGRNESSFPCDKATSLSQASFLTTALTQHCTTRLTVAMLTPKGNSTQGPRKCKAPQHRLAQRQCTRVPDRRKDGNLHA